jgi:thymidylate synthase
MRLIQGRTADEAWRNAHNAIANSTSENESQSSRAGETFEVLHAAIEIAEPRQRWIMSRTPPINPAFGIAEIVWILAGSNDAAVLNYWFPGLPSFQGSGQVYEGAYGYRLRHQFGIDQIHRACEALRSNPSSRQVVLQLWDARCDMPNGDGSPRCPDIPCNVVSLLKVRGGRLDWTQIMRSNDLFRGLPYNILQFTVLQEVLAGWLGLEVGSYHHWSDSLHIYAADLARFTRTAESSLARNNDSLVVDSVKGEALISELFIRMASLTKPRLTEAEIADVDSIPGAPLGYQNLLHVLSAESARRHGQHDHAQALMASCTNPQLACVWQAWCERVQMPGKKLGMHGESDETDCRS